MAYYMTNPTTIPNPYRGFVFCFYFVCLLIVFKVSSDNPIPHVSTLYCWIWTNNSRIQSCAVHLVCHHAAILAIDLHKIIILRVAFLFTESQPIGGVPYCAFGMFFEIINCSFVVLVAKTTRPCMYTEIPVTFGRINGSDWYCPRVLDNSDRAQNEFKGVCGQTHYTGVRNDGEIFSYQSDSCLF